MRDYRTPFKEVNPTMNTQASIVINFEAKEQLESLSPSENFNEVIEGNINVHSEIGLILPTYCEAANIGKLIDEIENLNMNISILVIDLSLIHI